MWCCLNIEITLMVQTINGEILHHLEKRQSPSHFCYPISHGVSLQNLNICIFLLYCF